MPLLDYDWVMDEKHSINDLQKMVDKITATEEQWQKDIKDYFTVVGSEESPVHELQQDIAYDALDNVEETLKKIKGLPKEHIGKTVEAIEELIREIGARHDAEYILKTAIRNEILMLRTGIIIKANRRINQQKAFMKGVEAGKAFLGPKGLL